MTEQHESTDLPVAERTSVPDSVLEAALDLWDQTERQHLIPITGNSMFPLIQDGDRVLVAHGLSDVRQGDVIVFRRTGGLIAHRVLRIYDDDTGPIFITKGDNARQLDLPLGADEIIGRVLVAERGKRHMSLDTASWRVIGWLIAVSTWAWTRLYARVRTLKRRLLGPQPSRVTTALQGSALACRSLALRAIEAVFCRWQV